MFSSLLAFVGSAATTVRSLKRPRDQHAADSSHADDAAADALLPPTRRARLAESATASDDASGNAIALSATPPQRSAARLSPAARCDLDSFSIVLSMLNTHDFISAIRVCKQWRAARMRHTAWPAFQLQSFVQSLRDDNYDDPARRRLRLKLRSGNAAQLLGMLDGSAASTLPSLASPAGGGSMWRHATDVAVDHGSSDSIQQTATQQRACQILLKRFARLSHLSAVNLQSFSVNEADAAEFFSAVSERLQAALFFESLSLVKQVHLLTNLRVLVARDGLTGSALLPLIHLEYLHFQVGIGQWGDVLAVGQALRWLSTHHSLVSISFGEGANMFNAHMLCIKRFLEPRMNGSDAPADELHWPVAARAAVHAVPAVDPALPCKLQDISFVDSLLQHQLLGLLQLPALTRLQSAVSPVNPAWPRVPLGSLARIQQLRLAFKDVNMALPPSIDWEHIEQSKCLRVLQLSCDQDTWGRLKTVSATQLQRVLAANCESLEELRIDASMRLNNDDAPAAPTGRLSALWSQLRALRQRLMPEGTAASSWDVLSRCGKLRELELALYTDSSPALFVGLSDAPAFQSLTLTNAESRLLPPTQLLPATLLPASAIDSCTLIPLSAAMSCDCSTPD